jgi:hypothetical protein
MNSDALAKIKIIRDSRRCLVFGVLGFIPAIGLAFALAGLWYSGVVRQREKQYWNAARPYRIIGMLCAAVSAVIWSGLLLLVLGNSIWFALFHHY